VRAWERPPEDEAEKEAFYQQSEVVCSVYKEALALAEKGVHVYCTDEKTGIQAKERARATLPMKPGRVEYQEFEYIRHGTCCLIGNFEVATGKVLDATLGKTRTEEDFKNHIQQTVSTDPQAEWIFIVDQLNTHRSESLVRFVAQQCDIADDLGIKSKSGILKSMVTRTQFLQDESHRIRFVYTPKHASWLNQIECWFSILVRRLLKRASFTSIENLMQRIRQFIDFFNKTMAKPFKWTYTGRPLNV
jgi:hypothetical protein